MTKKIELIFETIGFAGLCFVVAFLPFYNSLLSAGIGLAIFGLIGCVCVRPRTFPAIFLNKWILALIIASILSVIFSLEIKESLLALRKLALHIALFFAVVRLLSGDRPRARFIIALFLAAGTLVTLDGLYQYATGTDWFSARPLMREFFLPRITAGFHQAATLGIYLDFFIPLFFAVVFFILNGWKRWCGIALLVLMIIVLGLTLAVGAAAGVGLAIIGILAAKRRRSWLTLALGILAACIVMLHIFASSWAYPSLVNALRTRAQIWQVGLALAASSPLWGIGVGTFPVMYGRFCPPGYPYFNGCTPDAHNMYVQIAAETGLVSLAIFIVVIVQSYKKIILELRQYQWASADAHILLGLGAGLGAYLIHGAYESAFQTSHGAVLFWLILGFIVTFSSQRR